MSNAGEPRISPSPGSRPRATTSGLALALVLSWAMVCCTDGASSARVASASSEARRARPSSRAIERAWARVEDDVLRCLAGSARGARVRGAFRGEEGDFVAEQITTETGSALPFAVSTCVRSMVERARVRPFREGSIAAERSFMLQGAERGEGARSASATSAGSAPATDAGVVSATSTVAGAGPSASAASGHPLLLGAGPARFAGGPADLVRREHDALQRCFEQASEQAPDLEGEIEVRFTLDARGRVTEHSHRVTRERNGRALMALVGECVEAHVRLIAFGAQADGGGTYVVPIAFGSSERFGPAAGANRGDPP